MTKAVVFRPCLGVNAFALGHLRHVETVNGRGSFPLVPRKGGRGSRLGCRRYPRRRRSSSRYRSRHQYACLHRRNANATAEPEFGVAHAAVTAHSGTPPLQSPCLEYEMYLFDSGTVEVEAILSPTLNFVPGRGLRYAISFDDQPPQIVDALAQNLMRDWETTVKDGVRKVKSSHTPSRSGYHTLKFWMVDPALVLEKLVANLGGVKPSYLAPPASYRSSM